LVWAEAYGMGEMGLMPEQFWSLTKPEFDLKHEAFERQQVRELWLVGKLALLTQSFKGEPKTPGQLFGMQPMVRYPSKPWMPGADEETYGAAATKRRTGGFQGSESETETDS
jgi:hypothetical protein